MFLKYKEKLWNLEISNKCIFKDHDLKICVWMCVSLMFLISDHNTKEM